jgi:hypothetical protein
VTEVGTANNELETRTGLLEAETTTGGITIRNIGSVQIGGLTPDVDGLAGTTWLIIDLNNDDGYQAGDDLVVRLDSPLNLAGFAANDFI